VVANASLTLTVSSLDQPQIIALATQGTVAVARLNALLSTDATEWIMDVMTMPSVFIRNQETTHARAMTATRELVRYVPRSTCAKLTTAGAASLHHAKKWVLGLVCVLATVDTRGMVSRALPETCALSSTAIAANMHAVHRVPWFHLMTTPMRRSLQRVMFAVHATMVMMVMAKHVT